MIYKRVSLAKIASLKFTMRMNLNPTQMNVRNKSKQQQQEQIE